MFIETCKALFIRGRSKTSGPRNGPVPCRVLFAVEQPHIHTQDSSMGIDERRYGNVVFVHGSQRANRQRRTVAASRRASAPLVLCCSFQRLCCCLRNYGGTRNERNLSANESAVLLMATTLTNLSKSSHETRYYPMLHRSYLSRAVCSFSQTARVSDAW